ncbi:hypothetical protein, unknown function [Leishmania braziliensis MHOM/BR/75/M2904]|uniref:Uncharacterized protein n=2 Tax=Leishmania braziliensis TaxID=5660 RepID=A4H827_LEIBR|nr:hypothetical protein, unknown function [Leishmania braziliensis MHOM/BR/75/M2904]CAJ2469341.1 unnamed protein product [Leishmania braziliensis]CAM42075.2 hypothetical protein, unknown function [Leishmania braziliensis MHOM/BR/75/M2904]SYZ64192.1 hypothetical_protein [Leishmania braziliensis MHOM/BR/75/M2904]
MTGTEAAASDTSTPTSSSPPTAATHNDNAVPAQHQWQQQQQQQRHLLRCLALADLLDVSPTVSQQLVTAATAPSSWLDHTLNTPRASFQGSTESDSTMQAYHLERLLVAAVLKRLFDSDCGSATSVKNVSSAAAVQPAAPSVLTLTQQPARKRPFSSLTAHPWTPAPSESGSSCTSPQRADGGLQLLLPAVLYSPQGVARVDALHASFLPLLLVALLQHVSGECSDGGDSHVTGLSTSKRGDDASSVKTNTSAAVLSLGQQRCCRAALQRLLSLYVPLFLQRRRATCAAVSAIVESLQECSCGRRVDAEGTAEVEEGQTRIQRPVHHHLCCSEVKQWLRATRLLSVTLVASLSHVSRRTGTATAAALSPPSDAALVDEDDLMEARWTLEIAGVWMSAAGIPLQGGTPVADGRRSSDLLWRKELWRGAGMSASSDPKHLEPDGGIHASTAASPHREDRAPFTIATAEVIALAEIMCTIGEETCSDICPHDTLSPQQHEGSRVGEQSQSVPSCFTCGSSRTVEVLRDVTSFFLDRRHNNSSRDPLRTLPASAVSTTELHHRYVLLLGERLEEEQCQQHRLLAAAERAVHRVLRQQHRQHPGVLWQPPGMLVALCSVTSYQLRTQLHRREQRMAELCTATTATATATMLAVPHTNAVSFPPSGNVAADDKSPISNSEADENSQNYRQPPSDAPPAATAAKPAQLGETLWSEDDEDSDDAAAQHEKGQGRWCAHSMKAETALFAHGVPPPSLASPATRAAAAADTGIPTLSPPPPRSPVSSAPSLGRAPALLRYTPRTNSLRHVSHVHNAPPIMHASEGMPAAADEGTEDAEQFMGGNSDYYAPAQSMERLWELPSRVPQDWTPALATLMACCLLCLRPSSAATAASRLAVLLGKPLLSSHSAEAEFSHNTAATAISGLASPPLARRVTTRSLSLLDFGFSRRHEAPAAMASGVSVGSSGRSRSTANSIAGVSMAVDSTNGGGESTGAVGALAQWHLRGLIQQLRLPANGRVLPSVQAGTEGRQGSRATAPRTHSTTASSLLTPFSSTANRATALSSSASAAAGGASWFTLYGQTTRALDAAKCVNHGDMNGVAWPSLPSAGGVLRRLDPVSLLASCFALMHLLQTQPHFFQQAKLGGRTMQELRLGVLEARWGGEQGCATQMLQRHDSAACTVTVSVSKVSGALAVGTAGGHAAPRAGAADALHFTRGHSLWDCAIAAAPVGPLGMDASDDDGNGGDAAAAVPAAAVDTYSGVEDCCDKAAAAMCNLTEALLVAVSYVGCRAIAAALLQFAAPTVDSAKTVDASVLSCRGGGIAAPAATSPSSRDLWCDALQAITGLLLEAHRAHRGGAAASRVQSMEAAAERGSGHHNSIRTRTDGILSPLSHSADRVGTLGPTATATAGAFMPASSACTSASAPPQLSEPLRAFSVGAAPTTTSSRAARLASDTGRGSYSATSPPITASTVPPWPSPLSIEAQFGLGAFFIALVRALLQLHASSSTATEATLNRAPDGQKQPHWPQPLLCVVQCLYAVASIIDDLLHDYTHAPPAVLCDVLVIMLTGQPLPHSAGMGKEAGVAEPPPLHVSATRTAWEALHLTPFWDDVLLGSVEYASRAWACPEECNTSLSPTQLTRPPWQSLLGYIPCSRDPLSTSWLPAAFRGSPRSSTSWTLLALLAKEDDLFLESITTTAAVKPAHAAAAVTDGDDVHEMPTTDANAADEIRQLSISLVSSTRYAGWMKALCEAWQA